MHVFVTHLEPRDAELSMQQISVAVQERRPQMLQIDPYSNSEGLQKR